MNYIKSFTVILMFVLFAVCSIFAETEGLTKNAAGDYIYETTISSLASRRVFEEIKVINNSSYSLAYVTCAVTIKGITHNMKPISILKIADSEGFDGYYEDDMNKEFPKYFGKEGKFSKKNNNVVKFNLKFKEHINDVEITDVYDNGEDLCFVITDNSIETQVNQPAPVVNTQAPAVIPAQPTTTQTATPQNNNSGDTTVIIDGKTYLLHDGKAYPVQ